MTAVYPKPPYKIRAGFTLLELIGVLAIVCILAAVVTPTALRTLEATAISADKKSTQAIAAGLREYARTYGTMPSAALGTPPTWVSQIRTFVDSGDTDIWRNKRSVNRVLLVDPTALNYRAIVLSVMRPGLNLPTNAGTTAVQFAEIWNTMDGNVPASTNWPAGWTAAAVANAGQYLSIERVMLAGYLAQRAFTVSASAGAPSYTTTPKTTGITSAAQTAMGAMSLRPGDTIRFYRDAAATPAQLDMTYVVTDRDQNFNFDGTHWKAI